MSDLATYNASAQVPCPDCKTGVRLDGTGHPCMTCRGTPGWVYVLGKEVRVKCPKDWNWGPCPGIGQTLTVENACPHCKFQPSKVPKNHKVGRHSGPLPSHTLYCICQGRGWTPNPDGWAWWHVARKVSIYIDMHTMAVSGFFAGAQMAGTAYVRHKAEDDDPKLAFHTALGRALEAVPGVRFTEVT